MKLKAVLDTLDGVDEALKPAYTEKDGKFYLGIEGHDDHPDVKGLKTSLAKVRDEKKTIETKLNDYTDKFGSLPDDFLDEYNRLKDSGGGNVDQRLADQRNRMSAEKDAAVKKVEGERDTYKDRIERLARENAVNEAMTEANIAPHMREVVGNLLGSKAKVSFEGDETIVTIDDLPAVDSVKAWASTEKGKYFVAAPNNGGGGGGNSQPGAGGNAKDNPWSKEGFNLTKQMEIERADPQKAAALKAQAGVK